MYIPRQMIVKPYLITDSLIASFWTAEILLQIWGVRVAQFFSMRMPRVAAAPLAAVHPSVAVILPIKGVDSCTEQNIAALCRQHYPNYRLIFSVESINDPVVKLIENISAGRSDGRVALVVAGAATDRGQKVHNQLAAVAATTEDDQILAFMDADACPASDWLHALVTPLTYGPHIGATTGYRFYVPAGPSGANDTLCVLNSLVGSLMGPYRRTMAWGGSMAIRRADFFSYGVDALWQGALSDDYALSYCVRRKARTRIHFVPQCLVASAASFNWHSLNEFAVRQYRITRICAPRVWLAAISGALLFVFALLSSLVITLEAVDFHRTDFWIPLAVFLVIYLLSCLRGYMLLRGGRRLLPGHEPELKRARHYFIIGFPLMQMVNAFFILRSAVGSRIVWRGTEYQMNGLGRTRIVTR